MLTGHSGLERRIGRGLQLGLALLGGVLPELRLDQHGLLRRLLAAEDLQRERHAGAADRAGIGHRRAVRPSTELS